MKCEEMLEKIKGLTDDVDIEKVNVTFYETYKEEDLMYKTTIKIDREVC